MNFALGEVCVKRKSIREDVIERTKNMLPASQISVVSTSDGERHVPQSAPGYALALWQAHHRLRVLGEALRNVPEETGWEPTPREAHELNVNLKSVRRRIDWLEAKLREHGLSVPDAQQKTTGEVA
ncbi:hypothetical protein I7819_07065 [Burkholderia multivorans]|uniref:hypothetical protein n=1 Tax=Burkholderia multivorans TaxID=87883 RepID=UPI00190749EC|nr:hypothetical protein [Burkholderia multivorans]MBJ9939647.1 hypothetical protein [Burkholderia multivorans]MBU9288538.1 hypothetical protein [Burkholderia multivorans]